MNLSLLILIPLLTATTILFAPKLKYTRSIALVGSLIQVILSLILLYLYWNKRSQGDQSIVLFESDYKWFNAFNIHYHIGIDGVSMVMILLTSFVVVAGVLVSWSIEQLNREFFFLLIILGMGAYGFFISLDLFTLFFFLEISVIPKFLLIGIWGSGAKEYSAMKLALMLMGGSALVFVGLAGLYYNSDLGNGKYSFDMISIAVTHIPVSIQKIFFPFTFIGFGIFTAIFPFHTWVPDGHSSAPTAASMFLAGISMKLGGYGCLRIAAWLMPDGAHYYSPYIILLSTIAIIFGAFATMMQKDLKYINAYSSVSHCGFVLLGIGMLTPSSMMGSVLQMISHGLMTALFFAAIGMVYMRTHTRMVSQMGGLLKIMPFIASIFVIAGLCSLGLPGLSGFVAEITIFIGSWQVPGTFYHIATILACASIVVTAVYILRAVGQVIMGPYKSGIEISDPGSPSTVDAAWNEKLATIFLLTGILAIGIAPMWLNELLQHEFPVQIIQVARNIKTH